MQESLQHCAVCGDAVAATILNAGGEQDDLALHCTQAALIKGFFQPKIALEQNRRVCEHSKEVRNELKRLLDVFQKWARFLRGGFHADRSKEGDLLVHLLCSLRRGEYKTDMSVLYCKNSIDRLVCLLST